MSDGHADNYANAYDNADADGHADEYPDSAFRDCEVSAQIHKGGR
jgi:hypothetical protein